MGAFYARPAKSQVMDLIERHRGKSYSYPGHRGFA